ncbi:MAG: SDR family oxidoreductase [Deltaproteobacteria bacterium]|jgi:NAD(P)-dependent dehydrogenase (short-subunit alcohol dehydrogenase family)|nr:SDR family oxidoreductase [Deltaproteobacteria bacterium]
MTEHEPSPKVAIVTGASSGIGEATARRFAEGGHAVVLAARRRDLLDRIVADITRDGGRALAVPTDLSDAAATSALVRSAIDSYGRVDVLVNNAGYGPPYALEQLDRDRLRHVFDVNLLAAMQLIGELTPIMREQGGGRVVSVSSLSRYVGAPFASSYAATKGGMEAMNACARLELAPWNIQLSVVVPGFVDTPAFETSREAGKHLREDPDNPYRELMDNLDEFAQRQLESAIAPEEVAEVIWKAATVPNPKPRYFAPPSAGTAARMFAMMPTKLAERILRGMYKWGPQRKVDA